MSLLRQVMHLDLTEEGFVRIALVQDKAVLQQVVENIRNSGIFSLGKSRRISKCTMITPRLTISRGVIH